MDSHVIAFDPGKVTGWSRWEYLPDQPMQRLDYGLIGDGLDGVIDWCLRNERYLSESTLVCEGYIPESLATEWRTPIRIEGALTALAACHAVPPPIFQARATKRSVTDAVLKREGLWLLGSDPKIGWEDARDVNDSQLHALAWAKHEGHLPTIRRFWPED